MPVIDNYDDFLAQPNMLHIALMPGDILLKKVFPETARGVVEKTIVKAQKYYKNKEIQAAEAGNMPFDHFGSPTSEHAAIVVDGGFIAEADGGGVKQHPLTSRRDQRYVVYRCTETGLVGHAIFVALGLTGRRGKKVWYKKELKSDAAKYDLLGAAKSSSKPREADDATARYIEEIIECVNNRAIRPGSFFCSGFVMACYEAAATFYLEERLFGVDPRAMSPMRMEEELVKNPRFKLIGRVQSDMDLLVAAVEKSIADYEKTLGKTRFWRVQSEESIRVLGTLKSVCGQGMQFGDLFPIIENCMGYRAKRPYDTIFDRDEWRKGVPALSPKSTLFKKLADHLKTTALFDVPR
jgi:hypothetical protein